MVPLNENERNFITAYAAYEKRKCEMLGDVFGRAMGEALGKRKNQMATAQRALNFGISAAKTSAITGLTIDEVKELKRSANPTSGLSVEDIYYETYSHYADRERLHTAPTYEERVRIFRQMKADDEINDRINDAIDDGQALGEALAKGMSKRDAQVEHAKALLKIGLTISTIAAITGLNDDEVKEVERVFGLEPIRLFGVG